MESTTVLPSEYRRTSAVALPECRSTFVRLSCKTRKSASSAALLKNGAAATSIVTLIPLRSLKPSTYHCAAEEKPTSSSNGGGNRYKKVRISFRVFLAQKL